HLYRSVGDVVPASMPAFLSLFSFYCHLAHRDLRSFPTRRSSDLQRRRSSHWIMREAIAQYVEREEKRETLKRDTLKAWEQFQTTDRKSTRLNSSHVSISYAVFCLKKKKKHRTTRLTNINRMLTST